MTEDFTTTDNDLDPNMLSTMGFASFGMQPKPKKRKPNNYDQAARQLSQAPHTSARGGQQLPSKMQQKQAGSSLALRDEQKENLHNTHPTDSNKAPTHPQPRMYGRGWQRSEIRQPERDEEEAEDPHYQDDASSEDLLSEDTRDKEKDSSRRQQGQSVHPLPPLPPPPSQSTAYRPSHPIPPEPNTHPPQRTTTAVHHDTDGHLKHAQPNLQTSPPSEPATGGTAPPPPPGRTMDGNWDFGALSRGVRDQNGDLCFYRVSFVEDPWRGLS